MALQFYEQIHEVHHLVDVQGAQNAIVILSLCTHRYPEKGGRQRCAPEKADERGQEDENGSESGQGPESAAHADDVILGRDVEECQKRMIVVEKRPAVSMKSNRHIWSAAKRAAVLKDSAIFMLCRATHFQRDNCARNHLQHGTLASGGKEYLKVTETSLSLRTYG